MLGEIISWLVTRTFQTEMQDLCTELSGLREQASGNPFLNLSGAFRVLPFYTRTELRSREGQQALSPFKNCQGSGSAGNTQPLGAVPPRGP